MEWREDAVVLGAVPFGEGSAIAELLTETRGRRRGLVRGGRSSRRRGLLETGNRVRATWRGRLAEQLGSLNCEVLAPVAAAILSDGGRLAALRSACALLSQSLPEDDPHPRGYGALLALLEALATTADWPAAYARWEVGLLADLGFGLDLSAAGSDGGFVAAGSGRAVVGGSGDDPRRRLLPLPAFLTRDEGEASPQAMAEALVLTGYFLEKHLAEGRRPGVLPAARRQLVLRFSAVAEG